MSTIDILFLAVVIGGMLSLLGALAWAMIYTRETSGPAAPEPAVLTPAKRPAEDRTSIAA